MADRPTVDLRGDLDDLPRYVPGQAVGAAGVPTYKLSSNELPWAPLTSVRDRTLRAVNEANRYPDITAAELVGRLAERHGVRREQVVVGGGSIAVLQGLVQATCRPGASVVFAWRSFEAYPIVVQVCHARPVLVPLVDDRHDLVAMADAVVRTRAAMVVVCQPNNPTGTVASRRSLEAFLDAVPPNCLIVLDEAYREFVDDPDVPDGIELAATRSNVGVLRTFSKAHALAGLRVGYGIMPPAVADALRAVALPFTVSSVAQQAALGALDAWQQQRGRVADVLRRRRTLTEELRCQGYTVPRSQANFVWLGLGEATKHWSDRLSRGGVSVRPFVGEGLRVTVGEPEALAALLEITGELADRPR